MAAVSAGTPAIERQLETPCERLARALQDRNCSIRGFAHELAASDSRASAATWRRLLHKYLAGAHVPSQSTAELLGRLLGCEASELRPPRAARVGYAARVKLLERECDELRQRIVVLERRLAAAHDRG